jgi:hypothetical protein
VNVRARVAFATGVAGLAGATLVLSGRIDASVAVAVLFVFAARAAAVASLLGGGPVLADRAERSLVQQARLAPAWALIAVAAAVRAGSASLADVRGANAVAGLAVARGSVATVVAAWLALVGGVVAVSSFTSLGVRTASTDGIGVIEPPVVLRRLEAGGVLAQAALVVTLFIGPQVASAADAAWWIAGIAAIAIAAWRARALPVRDWTWIATGAAAMAALLSILGGAP